MSEEASSDRHHTKPIGLPGHEAEAFGRLGVEEGRDVTQVVTGVLRVPCGPLESRWEAFVMLRGETMVTGLGRKLRWQEEIRF